MNREQKLQTIRRWIDYVGLDLSDVVGDETLNDLNDVWLDSLLEEAEEDRARLIADGCFIKEDWTEAT